MMSEGVTALREDEERGKNTGELVKLLKCYPKAERVFKKRFIYKSYDSYISASVVWSCVTPSVTLGPVPV